MKKILLIIGLLVGFATVTANAQVNTFEEMGTVQSVQIASSVVGVNDMFFVLPSSIQLDGEPAILKLEPGHLIGFSGTVSTPYNRIEALVLYPSVEPIEEGGPQ